MTLPEHARYVASPIAPRPAKALLHKVGIVLQCGQYFSLLVILVCNLLLVGDKPSGDEIVVVCVQTVSSKPLFVRETMRESLILENVGPIGYRPAR